MLSRLVVFVLRPPLTALGWLGQGLHKLFLRNNNERLAKQHEQKLEADIRQFLPFLFENGAQVIANKSVEYPPPFDCAVITVEFSHLLLRFTRGRDHLAVQVAPESSPSNLHEVSTVLCVLGVPGVTRGSISGLVQANQLLRSHISVIAEAFTEARYSELEGQLREVYLRDRMVTKQLESEVNRRLYE